MFSRALKQTDREVCMALQLRMLRRLKARFFG